MCVALQCGYGSGVCIAGEHIQEFQDMPPTNEVENKPKLLGVSAVDYRDPAKGRAVRGMFAGIAGRYDLLNHLLSFNRDKAWRRKTVKVSGAMRGMKILDVCCGTGDLALAFRRALPHDDTVIAGADFTYEMLAVAAMKVQRRGAALPLTVADTLELPFADGTFDVCTVGFGIRNVQDVAAGIREMVRVVRPGGKVVILECTRPRVRVFRGIYRIYMTKVLPRVGHWLSRSKEKAYSYLPDSIELFPDADGLAALMRNSAGLTDVSYRLMNFGTVAIHMGVRPA